MDYIKEKLHVFFKGDERSVKAKRNILQMLFIKGGSILTGLLLIPMTLNYVDSSTYGIWLTLSSVIAWISFFDVGLNNGLKNRLTEAIASNNTELGKKYVSTTYALLVLIFIPLMLLLFLITPYIDWASLLKIQSVEGGDLIASIIVLVFYFGCSFILSTINVVMSAYQRPAQSAFCLLLQQVISLFIIYILIHTTEGSLLKLCLALCMSPLFVIVLFNLVLFRRDYKEVAPSLHMVDFKVLPDLLRLGVQFFIIQIAGIIQFQMVNFLIMRYYGADEVTAYNIANKYFGILYMVWGILIAPLWVAVTDAMAKGDFGWIINAKRKYLLILLLFIFIGIVMFFVSSYVYNIWVGADIRIEWTLSLSVLVYNLVLMFGSIYVMILNGLGKLKVQSIACIFSPVVFFASCYLFINMDIGVCSIIIASIIANFNGLLLAPMQLFLCLRKRSSH